MTRSIRQFPPQPFLQPTNERSRVGSTHEPFSPQTRTKTRVPPFPPFPRIYLLLLSPFPPLPDRVTSSSFHFLSNELLVSSPFSSSYLPLPAQVVLLLCRELGSRECHTKFQFLPFFFHGRGESAAASVEGAIRFPPTSQPTLGSA